MNSYRELKVWQKAMDLTIDVYNITNQFPKDEKFGLVSQIRRSAVSIPSNIAEGFGRNSQKEFKRFLQISPGSLFELQTQVEIGTNLNYVESDFF